MAGPNLKPPAFVDCYGDLAERLTPEMLSGFPDLEVYRSEPADEADLIDRLQGRRHAMVYMGHLTQAVLEACPELKSVAYLATGLTTHADLEAAARLGIVIEGVKGYGDRAVAEHTVALMLAALKRLGEMDRAVRDGGWGLIRAEEISAMTVGLIGLGGIGREVARIADALGARVIAWTRSGETGGAPAVMAGLDEVLAKSDIVSLHLALMPETEGFLDAGRFAAMKPGAVLVNTARAGIVDEAAMLAALRSGAIGHAALDVFHNEPPGPDDPLLAMENVTLTPHSAWFTPQAIDRLLAAGLARLREQIDRAAGDRP